MKRLFFSLWPDDDTRLHIAKWVRRWPRQPRSKQGKPVSAENLHITLAYIGPADAEFQDCLEEQAATVKAAPFALTLDQFGIFPKARVLWLGAEHTPAPLLELVTDLNAALSPCGYQADPRPFHPHMTLFRKVGTVAEASLPETTPEPIEWAISHFCLVESVTDPTGAQYTIVRDYPLGK